MQVPLTWGPLSKSVARFFWSAFELQQRDWVAKAMIAQPAAGGRQGKGPPLQPAVPSLNPRG